jgi:ABC-type transport system involved in multi-copper enzyme maturation permease subunit
MIWMSWRQQRTQTVAAAALVAVIAILLIITGIHLADLYSTVNACHTGCGTVVENFRNEAQLGFSGFVYKLAMYAMYVLPPLLGLFWGAPLVAREIEAGTHRLAWSQSVTRTRWLVIKLVMVGVTAMLTTGVFSLVATLALHHLDRGSLIGPQLFGARGIVPVAYTAFAFTLGVAVGAIVRRTVPAMAITLALYVVAVVLMPTVVRAHLMPTVTAASPIDGSRGSFNGIEIHPDGAIRVFGSLAVPDSWTISDLTVTPDGKEFTGPADMTTCGPDSPPYACTQWLGTKHLTQELTYQPSRHFWPLQWIESGIFVALALVFAVVAVWWTRRRLT